MSEDNRPRRYGPETPTRPGEPVFGPNRRAEIARGARERRQKSLLVAAKKHDCTKSDALDDAIEQLGHSSGHDPANPDSPVARDIKDYHTAVRSLFRAGYRDHPIVLEWLAGRRALDDIQSLRALKNVWVGLTRGLRRRRLADVWLAVIVDEMVAELKLVEPPGPAALRRYARKRLRAHGWLPECMTIMGTTKQRDALKPELNSRFGAKRQAFEKWLLLLGLHHPRPRRRGQLEQ